VPATSPYASRAALARATQTGNKSKADEARRALAEHRIQRAIEKAVASSPELTADQKARLSLLLHGTAA
jgi:hypothetical protein